MDSAQFLQNIKGSIPRSLYQELEYCVGAYANGKMTKEAYTAVLDDVKYELEQRKLMPAVMNRKTSLGTAYEINKEAGFNLLSEPTEGEFVETYHDLQTEEPFRADNPLEQKGRVVAPLYLDRWRSLLIDKPLKTLGLDVAREGDDKSAITILYGGHVLDIQAYWHSDIAETTGRVIACIEEHRPDEVIIDCTGGYGCGCADSLKSLGVDKITTITEVQFHALPRSSVYGVADARTEMAWLLAQKLRKGLITLPYHQALIEELSWLRFKYRLDGKLVLMEKKEMKKLHKRSPDHADSLMLANYPMGGMAIYT